MKFDLNCDLGEGEPRRMTAALLRWITSANIACGGHAGDYESMRSTVELALKNKVHVGAHPGLPDRANFGRRALPISVAEFRTLLLQQISALESIVKRAGGALHHVKLHGALYHMVENQASLRRGYLDLVRKHWPRAVIYSLAGGKVAQAAAKLGVPCWGEGFLDRGYEDATHLMPRGEPGSILTEEQFEERIERLAASGRVGIGSGTVAIRAETWCIHSDSAHALSFAKRAALLH